MLVLLLVNFGCGQKPKKKVKKVLNSIVFVSDRSGKKQLYSMSETGNNQRLIKEFDDEMWFPSFSSNGKYISFFGFKLNNEIDLYLINEYGRIKNLTNTPKNDKKYANFSPDSKKIAYTSLIEEKSEIVTINIDGTNRKVLTKGKDPDANPLFSPDGKTIYWSAQTWNKAITQVAKMDLNGNNKKFLTNNNTEDGVDSISPNGIWLAGSCLRDGQWDVMIYSSDGKKQIRVIKDADPDTRVIWQPNGNKVIWQHRVDSRQYDIYLIDFPNLKYKNITNSEKDDIGGVWTDDGRIVFTSNRDGDYEIYIMNSDGTNLKKLTDNQYEDSMPTWGRNVGK